MYKFEMTASSPVNKWIFKFFKFFILSNGHLEQLLPVGTLQSREQEGRRPGAVADCTHINHQVYWDDGGLLVQNIVCGARELGFAFMDGLHFRARSRGRNPKFPPNTLPPLTLAMGVGHGVGRGS